jgi:hypothetical protein
MLKNYKRTRKDLRPRPKENIQVSKGTATSAATITEDIKQKIVRIIAGHLDLYEPVAESITDEIVDLLEQRTFGLAKESGA